MTRSRTNTIVRLLVLMIQCTCWLFIAAWLLGKIVSDRYLWSQFLSWIPTVAPLATACVLWLVTRLAHKFSKSSSSQPAATRSPGVVDPRNKFPSFTAVALFSLLAWLAFVDIRIHSLVTGFGAGPSTISIRLLCWNTTSVDVQHMADVVRHQESDITILTNTPFSASLVPIRDEMSAAASSANKAPDTFVASSIRLNVISRFPVLHHAVMSLGITGAKERTFTWVGGGMKHIDTGQLMCVELDTTKALGKTTILWIVDLPSDPDIPRSRMMREFQIAVANFAAPIMRRMGDGTDRATPPNERTELLARLQHPDLIAGDFNTTRDSASLANFLRTLGSFEHAKSQSTGTGGVGWDFTYPRTLPLLHIDHVFVNTSAPLRATKYCTFDPHAGRHAVQVVDLALPK